jgi:hypothetical protein
MILQHKANIHCLDYDSSQENELTEFVCGGYWAKFRDKVETSRTLQGSLLGPSINHTQGEDRWDSCFKDALNVLLEVPTGLASGFSFSSKTMTEWFVEFQQTTKKERHGRVKLILTEKHQRQSSFLNN